MSKVKEVKVKVSAKVAKMKAKVAAKVGKGAKCCSVLGAIVLALAEVGCMDTNPASRATSSADKVGDIEAKVENCSNCTVNINFTKGDSALASADSSGSTETQTLSPTQKTDVSPKTDVNTTGGRSAGVLETAIKAGANWLMKPSEKTADAPAASATPSASAASATPAATPCAGGNCAPCTDGSCSTCTDCTVK